MSRRVPVLLAAVLVGSLVGAGVTLSAVGGDEPDTANTPDDTSVLSPGEKESGVAQFDDAAAFESYLRDGQQLTGGGVYFARERMLSRGGAQTAIETDAVGAPGAGGEGSADVPSRIGRTNTQVEGLDEPDVLKTDGRHFYYAPEGQSPGPVRPVEPVTTDASGTDVRPRPPGIHVVDASDPSRPDRIGSVNASGKLLQAGDTLVVLAHDEVTGYDVSDAADPKRVWRLPLNSSVVTAREQNGTVYLVTETRIGAGTPCPIEPLGPELAIPCDSVYRPGTQISADATYSAFAIDASTGSVGDRVSFVGTARDTVVYASPDAVYVTYTASTPRAELLGTFVREAFEGTPDWLADRVAEIESYNISAASKAREIRLAVESWFATLSADRRETVRESFRKDFDAYVGDHQRNLTRTGIVRVGTSGESLSVEATGTVPGRPLNQFSMSQHDGILRVTTTIPRAGDADSENDLYTLDAASLDRRGSVTGMGVTERVYSVRYVGDTAYVVTFRRIDPFHVVDLSDPDSPDVRGELKLPGFSSYLHPIDGDHVLGIGREDGQVKAVLFNVSDPENPTVADDHVLDARWSAIAESHHAFTIDRRHGVFFLPAGDSGIVMDYTNASLAVEKRVETRGALRARYVEDFLYVFGRTDLTVLNETTWEVTTRVSLSE